MVDDGSIAGQSVWKVHRKEWPTLQAMRNSYIRVWKPGQMKRTVYEYGMNLKFGFYHGKWW